MRVGSLFAGIGGFDLGLTWAGYEIAWQVELDEWCRRVLAKHWPEAERFADIRDCGLHNLSPVDVLCGGFPCQDISVAGRQAGLDGERSGLWWEMWRIIGELRPRYVLVENVPNLLIRGFDRVLGSLADIGYDAEWGVVSAHDVGAPHLRQRLWIVAYPAGARGQARDGDGVGDGNGSYRHEGVAARPGGEGGASAVALAYASGAGLEGHAGDVSDGHQPGRIAPGPDGSVAPEGVCERTEWHHPGWVSEPDVGRVAHGVSKRVDRLRGLGNAIVPQIAYGLALRIKESP
jgi:DNA (cytosine-5)-methyltransferase 1